MRRRAFLSTFPSLLAWPSHHSVGESLSTRRVIVATMGRPHPRVYRAIEEVVAELRSLKYVVEVREELSSASGVDRIIVGVPDLQNIHQLQSIGRTTSDLLAPDQFELEAVPRSLFVLGGNDRALVYGLSHLCRILVLDCELPSSIKLRRQPAFSVRRWSTAVSHDFGSPWDERVYIAQRFGYIKSEVFPRACRYGMNSVEINGRPGDGWDVDWVIGFEKYAKVAELFPAGERKQRLALVEDLAKNAHDNLLEILVWSHELHLPPGFLELYPQVRGVDYPVCLSNDFLHQFLRDKYREFFSGAPSVDGLVMSIAESGEYSLLTDRGCQCDRCRLMTPHDRIRAVLNDVITVSDELKKQIVLRTFLTSWTPDLDGHPEMETIRKAYTGLPRNIVIMSKYCPIDFYGSEIADNPLIGAFPNRSLVEFSLDVEWQGRTFVPVLTPRNFQRRIEYAVKKNCTGVVARVDFPFPTMEPEPIFNHPNDFNAWYMGELLWDPAVEIDEGFLKWSQLKYGSESALIISSALVKTEDITQGTFFCLGQTVINYHNMIAAVSFCDNSLWFTALSKWDPSKREISRSLFNPDEELIGKARQEKQAAVSKANEALSEVHKAEGILREVEFQRLRYDFEKLRDTAGLWDSLLELYLRHRQLASSPVKMDLLRVAMSEKENKSLLRMMKVAGVALEKATAMELRNGQNSWPVVSPDRGVSAYEFVNQILRHYIAFITREPVEDRVAYKDETLVFTAPIYKPNSTESLWRELVEFGRPGSQIGTASRKQFEWPHHLRNLHVSGLDFTVEDVEGNSLTVPLTCPARQTVLSRGSDVVLSITKHPGFLSIEEIQQV
jgi:hypothetical protein